MVDFVFNGRCFEWSIAICQGKESHWIKISIVRPSKAGFVSIHRLFRDPSNKTSNCVLLKIQIHFSQTISNERSLGSRAGCRPVFTISGELNGNGGKRCLSAGAVFDCKWFVRLAQRPAHTPTIKLRSVSPKTTMFPYFWFACTFRGQVLLLFKAGLHLVYRLWKVTLCFLRIFS